MFRRRPFFHVVVSASRRLLAVQSACGRPARGAAASAPPSGPRRCARRACAPEGGLGFRGPEAERLRRRLAPSPRRDSGPARPPAAGHHVPAHLCISIRHTPATTAGNQTTRAASTGQCRVSLLRRFAGGSQSRHVTSRLPGQGGGTRKYLGAASHLPPRGEAGHPVRVL